MQRDNVHRIPISVQRECCNITYTDYALAIASDARLFSRAEFVPVATR